MYQQFQLLEVTTHSGQLRILGASFVSKFRVFDGVTTQWCLQKLCLEVALTPLVSGNRGEADAKYCPGGRRPDSPDANGTAEGGVSPDLMLGFLLFVLRLLGAPPTG